MQYKYEHILIRYGELTIKGRNRKEFVKRLHKNIKYALKTFDKLSYQIRHDRMYIILNGENEKEIIPILKQIFGIHSFSLAIKVKSDIDKIIEAAYAIVKDDKEHKTFKVIAKRKWKGFSTISDDINRMVAKKILENTDFKVDVHNYDVGIIIEVNEKFTYVMGKIYQGAKGYPTGTAGKSMLLLSGGIDSPVAGNLIQKRGVYIDAVHFVSPPYTSQESLDKVKELAAKLVINQKHIRLFIVPFTKLQLAIHKNINDPYEITIMRRMMIRIANKLARENSCKALVSGESLGQVSSQTLDNINVINDVSKLAVLRPLISMDKDEIIQKARKIDTYEISIQPYDDACTIFNPKNPITKPKLKLCEFYENYFDYKSLVENCVKEAKIHEIRYDDLIKEESEIF